MKLSPSQHAYVENNISFKHWGKTLNGGNININSGISQGDSLSLIFFVLL